MHTTHVSDFASWARLEKLFFLRRAYFLGQARRMDFIEAFEANPKTATRRLNDAMGIHYLDESGVPQPYLRRVQNGVVEFRPEAEQAPSMKGMDSYLSQIIASGIMDPLFFCLTGVRMEELNLTRPPWINPLPYRPHTLARILKEINRRPGLLDLSYVSLSRGRGATRMLVIPLSLQAIGDQTSLYAHCLWKAPEETLPQDIETAQLSPQKGKERSINLVLSRVLRVEAASKRTRQKFRIKHYANNMPPLDEQTETYRVAWNPDLTLAQREVMQRELRVGSFKDSASGEWIDQLTHPRSRSFQFQRMFCDLPPQGVWPPLFLVGQDRPSHPTLPVEADAFNEMNQPDKTQADKGTKRNPSGGGRDA